jgi:hypothetical protein
MALLDVLKAIGFTQAEIVGEKKGEFTLKIRTDKGWTYERFKTADDVYAWANGKAPA